MAYLLGGIKTAVYSNRLCEMPMATDNPGEEATALMKADPGNSTLPLGTAKAIIVFVLLVCASTYSRAAPMSPPASVQATRSQSVPHSSTKERSAYSPPTVEEMAPMRPEYLTELAKIHEPPEMAEKPMQVRKAVSPKILAIENVMITLGSPDKATHDQRVTAIHKLLELMVNKDLDKDLRVNTYDAIAITACIDGADPQAVIGYANNAIGDGDEALALRARMYLKEGERVKALDDLEKVMVDNEGHSLILDGGIKPRKKSDPCGWSIADFDALGNDPRALAAKGLYLSAFIVYGDEHKETAEESDIRDLYARSATQWRSPIPHFLTISLDGLGSEHSMSGTGCIRGTRVLSIVRACAQYDEGTRRVIRELTMALVIDPTFAPALSERAERYLSLAQVYYVDGKPSRKYFELAIADFSAALAAGGRHRHTLYCDRALAQASIGAYKDAAAGYREGMKYAKNGIEDSPFVYEQLSGVYMKMGRFDEAANILTQAIMNASGGGMDVVILHGGMKAFRILYPEYDLLPDEILAEDVRRRYEPQFPKSWDAKFISKGGLGHGRVASSILPELYIMRGDAYTKAGRRADALSDYKRVKSDAWYLTGQLSPRHTYFTERGRRNYEQPEPWPAPPPKL